VLARKSLLIVATNLVGAVSGLGSLFFMGRYLNSESVGMLAYALSIAGMVAFLGSLGLESAHQKRVSEGRPLGDALATYVPLKLAFTFGYVLLVVAAVLAWGALKTFEDTRPAIIFVALAYQALLQLRFIPVSTFNALLETAKTQTTNLAEQVTKLPLVALAALMVAHSHGTDPSFLRGLLDRVLDIEFVTDDTAALLLGLAYTAAVVASFAVGLWFLRRHRYPWGRYDPALARSYMSFGLPIAVFSALYYIATQVDTFMVGYFWGASQAGVYFAAQRLTSLVFIVPMAVGALTFPRVSELAAKGDVAGVRVLAADAQRQLSRIVILATMFLIVYARQGIRIFIGDAFLAAAPIVTFLALYALFFALATVPSSVVTGFNKPRWAAGVGVLMVGTNIVLNLVFIPPSILGVPLLGLKAVGAAQTTAIAQALSVALLLGFARRLTGATLLDAATLKQAVAATAVGLVLLGLARFPVLDGSRVWELALDGVLGTLLYALALRLLGELHSRDLHRALDLLHPGKMMRYIAHELRTVRR
jgi:O-antigen/teichoic acid export membrane protein